MVKRIGNLENWENLKDSADRLVDKVEKYTESRDERVLEEAVEEVKRYKMERSKSFPR